MNEEISKLIARNKQLKSLLDDCQKKNTLLKETLSHSILELNNANVKHNERIALMEKEIIAANDIAQETDALNQKQKEMTLRPGLHDTGLLFASDWVQPILVKIAPFSLQLHDTGLP